MPHALRFYFLYSYRIWFFYVEQADIMNHESNSLIVLLW